MIVDQNVSPRTAVRIIKELVIDEKIESNIDGEGVQPLDAYVVPVGKDDGLG